MSSCCITSCKNRHYSSRKLKFYRIPCDYRPFQANRRRLWLRAIQRANGSTEPPKDNARICGAHFISGEASMDHDSPDFVPSVFTHTPQSPSPKKKLKWVYGRRKRRWRAAHTVEEETAPPTVGSPLDRQSSALLEQTQTPSEPKEGKALIKEAEAETKAVKEQRTFKVPTGIPKLDNVIPVVLLKSVYAPDKGYCCELCNQYFPIASQLVKHKQLHDGGGGEENSLFCTICGKVFTIEADFTEHQCVHEPSFQCNMCDRSFTTNKHLKRHKLLHVKDGRKCKKCGVLFCQRHNHVLYKPQIQTREESSSESEEEPQHLGSSLMPENNQLTKPAPNQTADLHDDAQSTIIVTPSQETTAQTALRAPPNLKPLPNTDEVKNDQLVNPVPNQTADLPDDPQSTTTVTPLQENTQSLFSCNKCDQSFTTSYGLNRHRLTHFQESERCNTCGQLSCQCYAHVLSQPQVRNCEELCPTPEQVSSITKAQCLGSSLLSGNNLLVNSETNRTADQHGDAESTITITPLQETTAQTACRAPPNLKSLRNTPEVEPPASHREIPLPSLIQSFTVPQPRRPPKPSALIRLQHPKLPPSLKLFSPQYLTSTFIEVKRNYDYILSKSRGVKIEEGMGENACMGENYVVKEEPCELPLSPPRELNIVNVGHIKKESSACVRKQKIAYDLEFVL